MFSRILEITACVIAVVFGFIGFFYGTSPWSVAISGFLVAIVVIYLSQLAELMQFREMGASCKKKVIICEVFNKLMYVAIIAQVIAAALMVK